MKRMTALLAVLLAGILVAASVTPWGLPTGNLVQGPTEREDGTVLVGENRWATSRVYTLRDGQVVDLYEESRLREGRESSIARVTALEDGACFIRVLDDGADWELVGLENGTAQLIHQAGRIILSLAPADWVYS